MAERPASIPFGRCTARRRYVWVPPVGAHRRIDLEIGSPIPVRDNEWACRFRITGLPKAIDTAAHAIDAVQALELALLGAGTLLSQSPQFRAGQMEMWNKPVKNAAELLLPLPMNSLQGTLENLRGYLERQQEKEGKTKRDWFDPEWRRALLSMMREISGDLATLVAHLPIAPRSQRKRALSAGSTRVDRGRGASRRSSRPPPSASRTPPN